MKIIYIDDRNRDFSFEPNTDEMYECAQAYFERLYGAGVDYKNLIDDFNLLEVLEDNDNFNDFAGDYFEDEAEAKNGNNR